MKKIVIVLFCLFLISCSSTKLITESNTKLIAENKILKEKLSKSKEQIDKFEKSPEFTFSQYLNEIKSFNNDKNIVHKNKLISISKDFIKKYPGNKYAWIAKYIIAENEANLKGNLNYFDNKGEISLNQNELEAIKGSTQELKSNANYSENQAIRKNLLDPITLIPDGDFLFIFKLVKVVNNIQGVDLEFELLNLSGEFVKNFWLQAELQNKKGEFIKAQELLVMEKIENDQIAKVKGIWESVDAYNIGFVKIKTYIIETSTNRNFQETQKILIQPNIFDIVVTF